MRASRAQLAMALSLLAGCGAGASSSEPEPFGWCCDDACGMDYAAADAALEAGMECTCQGIVRLVAGSQAGACIEDYTL